MANDNTIRYYESRFTRGWYKFIDDEQIIFSRHKIGLWEFFAYDPDFLTYRKVFYIN